MALSSQEWKHGKDAADTDMVYDDGSDDVAGIVEAPKPVVKREYALEKSSQTPWLIDLFASVSLAGVVVFNAAGFSVLYRLLALAALLVALVLETKYSAGAQARSDRYLMMTLGGIVIGFIVIIIGSVILLTIFDNSMMPWVLFGVISLLGFVVARLFRYATGAYVDKQRSDSHREHP